MKATCSFQVLGTRYYATRRPHLGGSNHYTSSVMKGVPRWKGNSTLAPTLNPVPLLQLALSIICRDDTSAGLVILIVQFVRSCSLVCVYQRGTHCLHHPEYNICSWFRIKNAHSWLLTLNLTIQTLLVDSVSINELRSSLFTFYLALTSSDCSVS
jgi:hypothetical protein